MNRLEQIKQKDVDAFAKLLNLEKVPCEYCLYNEIPHRENCNIQSCEEGIKKWLLEEVKGNE